MHGVDGGGGLTAGGADPDVVGGGDVAVGVFVGAAAGFTSTPDITQTPSRHENPLPGCAVTQPLARPAPPPPVDDAAASGGCQ